MKFFNDNGNFSWRKAGTAICFISFAQAVIGYSIIHRWAELPGSYLGIIAGVFIFYFGKRMIEGFKITKNGDS